MDDLMLHGVKSKYSTPGKLPVISRATTMGAQLLIGDEMISFWQLTSAWKHPYMFLFHHDYKAEIAMWPFYFNVLDM